MGQKTYRAMKTLHIFPQYLNAEPVFLPQNIAESSVCLLTWRAALLPAAKQKKLLIFEEIRSFLNNTIYVAYYSSGSSLRTAPQRHMAL